MIVINDLHLDFLKELTTICVGHAANRLSIMFPFPVMISLPDVRIIKSPGINKEFSSNSFPYKVQIDSEGDLNAQICICLSGAVPEIMAETNEYIKEINRDEKSHLLESMLLEMANILCSAYMTTIEQFAGILLIPKVPRLVDSISLREGGIGSFSENNREPAKHLRLYADLIGSNSQVFAQFHTIIAMPDISLLFKKMWRR